MKLLFLGCIYLSFFRIKKIELDEDEREEVEDHDLIQADLVFGLLQTGLMARLRYLLEEANIYTHAFMVQP